ncbi:MAG TPA: hypothetical protein VJJ21_02085 [Candidatus Nanoarchaeia archaeon]|nr:hypothetical protein [Candidatus Nanoarchaeia archaeon]
MERELEGKDWVTHTFLGFLPEQEFLERTVPGYNPRSGVNLSAAAEIVACGAFAYFHPDYAILATLDALLAGTRINTSGKRRGVYALELPYEALKFVGQSVASHVTKRKNYS